MAGGLRLDLSQYQVGICGQLYLLPQDYRDHSGEDKGEDERALELHRSKRSALRWVASPILLGPTRRSFAAAPSDERPPGPNPNAALGTVESWLQ